MPRRHDFATGEQAAAEMQRWKDALPAVESAYLPSGRLPPGALMRMLGGAAVGVPAGALAGAVIGTLGILIARLVPLELLDLLVTLGACALMFPALGCTPGFIVSIAGQRGKNRNRPVAVALAVMSALGATLVLRPILAAVASLADSRGSAGLLVMVFGPASYGEFLGVFLGSIGPIGAALAAGAIAGPWVRDDMFCETCGEWLGAVKERPISFAGATEAVKYLSAGDTERAAAALSAVTSGEREGTLELSRCPKCGGGYAEIKLHFSAWWTVPDPRDESRWTTLTMSESWRVFSRFCPPAGMALLASGAPR